MKLERVVILLPCQSLEDLSLDRNAEEAEELLSAWAALYHPAILAGAGSTLEWVSAEDPPAEPCGSLVVVPRASAPLIPSDWIDEAVKAGACIIRDTPRRDEILSAALEQLDGDPEGVDPQLVADFLALGFCHFQVELLTRQLRYMSNLDEEQFQRNAVSAAEAAFKGDEETAREDLRSAFDLLTEAREYFYPVEANLLDLTLVAPTTLGESLRQELAGPVPTNLLLSSGVVEQMAEREPATLAALKAALESNKASIIGGEFDEQPLPLLPMEAIFAELMRGLKGYQRHLGRQPSIFGRRQFGLSPLLPQVLRKLGFVGTIHFTLDDGRFPSGNQSKICWEGIDGTQLDALARVPLDASRSDVFLKLAEKLGDAMDLDHAATAVLAHWPGKASPWYEDMKRMDAYSPVLGKFVTIGDYFNETGMSGQVTRYGVDEYRSPYLRQEVAAGQRDPISRWVRYHGHRAQTDAAQTLNALADMLGGSVSSTPASDEQTAQIDRAQTAEADALSDEPGQGSLEQALDRFSTSLPRQRVAAERGLLLVNPCSFSRPVEVDVSELAGLPAVEGAVRAARDSAGGKRAVVEVPSMGFAWIAPGAGQEGASEPVRRGARRRRWGRKKPPVEPAMAEENVLRNEYFEATIEPTTGAIRSITDYHSRGNRLAQQLALRMSPSSTVPRDHWSAEGPEMLYSLMAADEISVTSAGPLLGEIVSRGRLVDREGRRLAGFSQTMRARRGSRVLELTVQLDVDQLPGANPWESYYAVRFAWNDATANVYRSVSLASRPSDCVQLEAPHFIDLRAGEVRTTLLTGGLPYHRRFGLRKLDTLLVVRGESARRFRLGIGIDLPHPVPAAIDFLAPSTVLSETAAPPPGRSGWLFHLDARNVTATYWEPIALAGRVEGVRVRLLETEGRRTRLGLRSFRPIESARKINPGDEPATELPTENDRMMITLKAHEWVEVEARWGTNAS